MSYIILFQSEKGKRRHPYDEEIYDTKEMAEQQLNNYVEEKIKLYKLMLEQAKLEYQEKIKNVPKWYTSKEV